MTRVSASAPAPIAEAMLALVVMDHVLAAACTERRRGGSPCRRLPLRQAADAPRATCSESRVRGTAALVPDPVRPTPQGLRRSNRFAGALVQLLRRHWRLQPLRAACGSRSWAFQRLAIGAIASLQAWSRVLCALWLGLAGRPLRPEPRAISSDWVALAATVAFACGLFWARSYAAVARWWSLCCMLVNGAVVPAVRSRVGAPPQRRRWPVTASVRRRWTRRVTPACACGARVGFISAVVLVRQPCCRSLGIDWFPALVVGTCALP